MMHFYVVELLLLFIIPPVGMDAKFHLEGKEIYLIFFCEYAGLIFPSRDL